MRILRKEVLKINKKEDNRIPLYFLNNFIKFERKLYQFANIPLGRPIKLKSAIYFLVALVIGVVIYFTPVINVTIRWMPPAVLIMIPVGTAWILTDVGTEDRLPMKFFKSFLKYNLQKIKGGYLYRNKNIEKLKSYSFGNYISYSTTNYSTEMGAITLSNEKHETDTFSTSSITDQNESNHNVDKSKEVELVPVNNSPDLTSYLFGNDPTDDVTESVANDEFTNVIEEIDQDKLIEIEVETETNNNQIDNDGVTVPDKKLENVVVKEEKKRLRKISNDDKKRDMEQSKVIFKFSLVLTAFIVVVGLIVVIVNGFGDSSNKSETKPIDNLVNSGVNENQHEEHLLKGIKQASLQNYKQAVIHFDEVDFNLLEKEDKEIVLLSYLFTDQIEKILELDSEFDEVVTSYYVAKENVSMLRQYKDRSDEFKFVLAIEDNEYGAIVDLKDKVFVDEEREVAIANAYIELEQIEEALEYAETTDNEDLINSIKKRVDSMKDNAKENKNE